MTLRCGVGEWARGRHILSSLSSLVGFFFLHVLQLPDSPGLHRSESWRSEEGLWHGRHARFSSCFSTAQFLASHNDILNLWLG